METEAPMTISKNQLLTKSLLYGLVQSEIDLLSASALSSIAVYGF